MQIENTEREWGAVQRVLHWTIAVMVLAQLLIGDIMFFTSPEAVPGLWFYIHPTMGILIGVFMLGRLAWRETHVIPAVPEDISTSRQVLSQFTHYSFYFLLICNPLVGWLLVGAMGQHVHFFDAGLPDLMGKSAFYDGFYFWMHLAFGGLIALFFVVHFGAALYHEFLKRDNVLRRMLGFIPLTAERQAVQDDPAHRNVLEGERQSALVAWADRHARRPVRPDTAVLSPLRTGSSSPGTAAGSASPAAESYPAAR